MVSEDGKLMRIHHVAEIFHGLIGSQQLLIVGVVFLLSGFSFLEKKAMPGVVGTLLQHGTPGGSGGVCDECKWRGSSVTSASGVDGSGSPGDEMRALDSGAGESVMEFCIGTSSVGQKSPVEFQHAREATELTGGLQRDAVLKMSHLFLQRSGTLGGRILTEEGNLESSKHALRLLIRIRYL
jgi:hypothetical protein